MHQMTRTDQRNKKRRETEVQKRKRATTAAVVVALWRKWRNGVCVLSRLSTSPFFFSILPGVNWKRYKTIKQKKVHTKTITQRVSNKKERGLDQSSNRWLTSFNSPGRQVSRVVSDAIGGPVFFKNVFFSSSSLLAAVDGAEFRRRHLRRQWINPFCLSCVFISFPLRSDNRVHSLNEPDAPSFNYRRSNDWVESISWSTQRRRRRERHGGGVGGPGHTTYDRSQSNNDGCRSKFICFASFSTSLGRSYIERKRKRKSLRRYWWRSLLVLHSLKAEAL